MTLAAALVVVNVFFFSQNVINLPNFNAPTVAPVQAGQEEVIKIATSEPSLMPSPSPTPSPSPKIKKPTPKPSVVAAAKVDKTTYIIGQINEFRRGKGLKEVKQDPESCSFAQTRAGEISQSFNHDGFTNRINSSSLPYSKFSKVVENMAQSSDYMQVFASWQNSSQHNANMSEDLTFGCVRSSGDFYVFEGWRP